MKSVSPTGDGVGASPSGSKANPAALRAAIFLDKDGTLLVDRPYNVDPQRMQLAPRASLALAVLASLNAPIFVISNQAGVALGKFPSAALDAVGAQLDYFLGAHGAQLSGFYWCPHHVDGLVAEYSHACDCRKPRPGLFLKAAREHRINLETSWMVGDILDDIEAGHKAGCRSILIDNGNETEWHRTPAREPDAMVGDLLQAAFVIARHWAPVKPEALYAAGPAQSNRERRACKVEQVLAAEKPGP